MRVKKKHIVKFFFAVNVSTKKLYWGVLQKWVLAFTAKKKTIRNILFFCARIDSKSKLFALAMKKRVYSKNNFYSLVEYSPLRGTLDSIGYVANWIFCPYWGTRDGSGYAAIPTHFEDPRRHSKGVRKDSFFVKDCL